MAAGFRDRLLPDRRRDAEACAAVAAAGRLLPADRGFVPLDEPELLRDRGGEDARVAMFVRLQDQRLISGVTRREFRQPLDGPSSTAADDSVTATDDLSARCHCRAQTLQRWLR